MFNTLDNWIPQTLANELESVFLSQDVPWHYIDASSHPELTQMINQDTDLNVSDSHQFVHILFDEQPTSEYWDLVRSMLYFYEFKTGKTIVELGRIKANMLFQSGSINTPHVDQIEPGWTSLVYYVNDSDGDTVCFNKKHNEGFRDLSIVDRRTPKKGTATEFESHIMHSSTDPTNTYRRIVLNFVFKTQEKNK